jgi:hypothetical protein
MVDCEKQTLRLDEPPPPINDHRRRLLEALGGPDIAQTLLDKPSPPINHRRRRLLELQSALALSVVLALTYALTLALRGPVWHNLPWNDDLLRTPNKCATFRSGFELYSVPNAECWTEISPKQPRRRPLAFLWRSSSMSCSARCTGPCDDAVRPGGTFHRCCQKSVSADAHVCYAQSERGELGLTKSLYAYVSTHFNVTAMGSYKSSPEGSVAVAASECIDKLLWSAVWFDCE